MPPAMAYWLFKTEPSTYSWDDLQKDKTAVWDGVTNPVALKNLRGTKKGDLVLLYHTGSEKRVVGVAEITRGAYPDPTQRDERLMVVDLEPRRRLNEPVPLEALKKEPSFAHSPLLRIGRLSVVAIEARQWKAVMRLGQTDL
jgi:predicted RNA-binding protein with PUA-like domain